MYSNIIVIISHCGENRLFTLNIFTLVAFDPRLWLRTATIDAFELFALWDSELSTANIYSTLALKHALNMWVGQLLAVVASRSYSRWRLPRFYNEPSKPQNEGFWKYNHQPVHSKLVADCASCKLYYSSCQTVRRVGIPSS